MASISIRRRDPNGKVLHPLLLLHRIRMVGSPLLFLLPLPPLMPPAPSHPKAPSITIIRMPVAVVVVARSITITLAHHNTVQNTRHRMRIIRFLRNTIITQLHVQGMRHGPIMAVQAMRTIITCIIRTTRTVPCHPVTRCILFLRGEEVCSITSTTRRPHRCHTIIVASTARRVTPALQPGIPHNIRVPTITTLHARRQKQQPQTAKQPHRHHRHNLTMPRALCQPQQVTIRRSHNNNKRHGRKP
mmetsp:Transcript_4774/g.13755  ORF Transcript_4774/g.13755 Transcript_4774/m.13755 type:complete len:245 (+) Transcript_4774:153-887(+)